MISNALATVIAVVDRLVGQPVNALHLPCGDGRDSVYLLSAGWTVTCADSSEKNLILTSQALAEADMRARLLKTSYSSIPSQAGLYDVAVTLPYGNSRTIDGFSELCRVLKPGGIAVIRASKTSLLLPRSLSLLQFICESPANNDDIGILITKLSKESQVV